MTYIDNVDDVTYIDNVDDVTYIDNVDDVTYIDNVDEMEDDWARGFVDVDLLKTCSLNDKYYLQLEQRHM